MILDIIAEYIPDGDTILGTAYLLDPDDEVFHPELVVTGVAKILYLGTMISKAVTFDKRMGNSDGAFKFTFSHPPKIKNLQFSVSLTLVDGSQLIKTVGILVDGEDDIPLAQNLAAGSDHRSRLREKEGL